MYRVYSVILKVRVRSDNKSAVATLDNMKKSQNSKLRSLYNTGLFIFGSFMTYKILVA